MLAYLLTVVLALAILLLGIGMVAAQKRLFRSGRWDHLEPVRLLVVIVGWLLIAWGLCAGLSMILGLLAAIFAVVVLAMVAAKWSVRQRYLLFSTLALAAERQMPLAPALEAFAAETGGRPAVRARRLAALLRSGCPLPEALERVPGVVPRDAVAAIRIGCQSGALGQAVSQALEDYDLYEPIWAQTRGRIAYFCFLILFAMGIGTFLMLKIVPEFEKIFIDFGADLPGVTIAVIEVARFMMVTPIGALLSVFVPLACMYLIARFIGWIDWELPGSGPLARRFHAAPTLGALALVADRGMTFRDGFAILAQSYPAGSIRRRLRSVLENIDAGADWAESLHQRGLIKRADLAVLQAAGRLGNLPWAMREMAASSRRRLLYRVQALVQVLFVAAILAFGAVVMVLVVSFFLPLISLIQNLT